MRVKCQSGLMGERSRLRTRYSDFDQFEAYSEIYNLAARLGFESAQDAWEANPVIESSVKPEDFRMVRP